MKKQPLFINAEDLYNFNSYPYIEDQIYYTEDGALFKDSGGGRACLPKVLVFNVDEYNKMQGNKSDLVGSIIIKAEGLEVSVEFINEDGEVINIL